MEAASKWGRGGAPSQAKYKFTSDVLKHKWRASLKTTIFIWIILTSNTEATENKVEFLNYAYTVKVFQYHSNNSLQLWIEEKTNKQYTLFKCFL